MSFTTLRIPVDSREGEAHGDTHQEKDGSRDGVIPAWSRGEGAGR